MQVLLVTVLRWLLRHLLSLALIIAVLLLGQAGWAQWREFQALRTESAQLVPAQQRMTGELATSAQTVSERANAMRSASLQQLETRVAAVDREIANLRLEKNALGGISPILDGQPIVQTQTRKLLIDAQISLLERERAWLLDLQLRLIATTSAQAQRAELERLRQQHQRVYLAWQSVGFEREALELQHPVRSRIAGTDEYRQRQALNDQREALLALNRQADTDYRRQLGVINGAPRLPPLPPLTIARDDIDALLAPLGARIQLLEQQRQTNWVARLWRPVGEVLGTALLILLGVIVTPIAIKALFYFVLAPLAARRPPVLLLPLASGALRLEGGTSSVSRPVVVNAGQELLVHPQFLQSAAIAGEKSTQWLLDTHFPLSSLSAGMFALTRIRTLEPQTFVISATHDAFSEIGVLDLPEGSALVMQPHNLVGVLQRCDAPLRITAHWRLTSLHAWLTLQLRYLALHGPAQLIVQGCRGVRIERADGGRAINQAATIGFSANLPYATRRCETFAAYLFGQQELLNDQFGSAPSEGHGSDPTGSTDARPQTAGFYVYEEMPHAGKKTGITGRGLEGLTDSVLKVFGV